MRPLVVGNLLVTIALGLILARPRSFGGDFWLHLWLVHRNHLSWTEHGAPTLLTSFSPVGTLAVIPDYTGGAVYSLLGLLDAIGLTTYHSLVAGIIAACLCAYTSSYKLLESSGVVPRLAALFGATVLAFPFIWGDGLGRGGVSSMLSGLFGVTAMLLIFRRALQRYIGQRPTGLVSSACFIALAGATHLPSFVVLGGIGLPLLAVSLLVWRGRAALRDLADGAAAAALGALCSAAYWLPALAFKRDSSFAGGLWVEANKGFSGPNVLWATFPNIPRFHEDFWAGAIGPSYSGPTSLIVTQPTLIIALLLLAGTPFVQKRLATGLLVSLVVIYTLVMAVDLWIHLPAQLQSLQFTFRLLYLPIPFVMFFMAAALSPRAGSMPQWRLRRNVFLGALGFQAACVVVQVFTTTNLSLVAPTGSATVVWTYDVAPDRLLDEAPAASFWYSSGESVAIDSVDPGLDLEALCPSGVVGLEWETWPGQLSQTVRLVEGSCLKFPLRLPISWLSANGADLAVRSPDYDVVFVPAAGSSEVTLRLAWTSPQVLGLAVSTVTVLGMCIAGARQLRRRRRA